MTFRDLVLFFERLEGTAKRLQMFQILAELFKAAAPQEIDKIVYLVQGELLPAFHGVTIGMSGKYIVRSLARAGGIDLKEVEADYRRRGDLGASAEQLFKRNAGKGLGVAEIYERFFAISRMTGEGSVERKVGSLSALFADLSDKEAKYAARFIAGRLRLGVGDMTLLEALAVAGGDRAVRVPLERAYNLCSDLGLVAGTFFLGGVGRVEEIGIRTGYPIRPALCERLVSAEEIIAKIGRCAVEQKMDGLRLQIHKNGPEVALFSRNLERVTDMFPEIAAVARSLSAREAIFEGEALAINEATGELFPFQVTIQRKRKHHVEEMAKEFPLKFFVFDLLRLDGEDYTRRPYAERRAELGRLIKRSPLLELTRSIETDDPAVMQRFFEEAVEQGVEGIVAKRLDAPYSAGSRNFNWIKLKRSYRGELADTIDLVIVGYFAGRGQRARFGIGAVLGAVYDPSSDTFKTLSKVGSGFTDEEWIRLKEELDRWVRGEKPARVDSIILPDVWVEPRKVLTVTADEITRSPNHTCGRDEEGIGYALRFPRAQGFLREDKGAEEANRVEEIEAMFARQRKVGVRE